MESVDICKDSQSIQDPPDCQGEILAVGKEGGAFFGNDRGGTKEETIRWPLTRIFLNVELLGERFSIWAIFSVSLSEEKDYERAAKQFERAARMGEIRRLEGLQRDHRGRCSMPTAIVQSCCGR